MTNTLYSGIAQPILTPAQTPEQVTESRWHQPWSEPSVKGKFLLTAEQSFFAYGYVFTTPVSTQNILWHVPWSWVMMDYSLIAEE